MARTASLALAILCWTSSLLCARAVLPPFITGFRGLADNNCTGRRVTTTLMGTSSLLPVRDYASAVQLVLPNVADHLRVTYNASEAEIQTFRGQLLTTVFPQILNLTVDPQLLAANGALGGDNIIPVNVSVQAGKIYLGLYQPPPAIAALLGSAPLTAASVANFPPEILASPLAPNAILAPWSRNSSVAPVFGTLTGLPTIDPTALFQLTEGGYALTLLRPFDLTGATIPQYTEKALPAFSSWLWSAAQLKEVSPAAGQEARAFQYYFITPVPKLPGLQSVTELWEWNTVAPAGITPLGAGEFVGASIAQPRANGTVVIEKYIFDLSGPPLVDCASRPATFFGSASFSGRKGYGVA